MQTNAHPFPMRGGLNLAGVTNALKPGEVTLMENFENLSDGGYRRYDGYERYDGRAEPYKATYRLVPFAVGLAAGIVVGNTVTGATSAATGNVLAIVIDSGAFVSNDAAGTLILDRITGTFAATELLTVGGTNRATKSGAAETGSLLEDDFDTYTALAADSARSLILAVPGQGSILGVAIYNGVVYAFRNAVGGATAVMWGSSAAGWVSKKTGLAPNGRYELIVNNFKGATSAKRLYGASGTHKAFEFDGTTWVDITTGMTVDTPTHIAAHKNYLFLSFANGSLQNSGVGDPTGLWTPRTGANEIGIGDDITALLSMRGGVLAVYGKNSTHLLYGAGAATWELRLHAGDAGAAPYTVQESPGGAQALDNRGLMPLSATQSFGDFESAAVSQRVQKFMDARRGNARDSTIVRDKSQYRIWFADGTALTQTWRGGRIVGYSVLSTPIKPTCAANGDDANGNEMLVIGADNGFVYRTDVGWSFDGLAIDSVLRTAPDNLGKQRQIKVFSGFNLQVSTPRQVRLLIQIEYDYALEQADISQTISAQTSYSLGLWDAGKWDEMIWDSADERGGIAYPEARIDGVGLTVSALIYHGQEIKPPFTVESGCYNYRLRGFRR